MWVWISNMLLGLSHDDRVRFHRSLHVNTSHSSPSALRQVLRGETWAPSWLSPRGRGCPWSGSAHGRALQDRWSHKLLHYRPQLKEIIKEMVFVLSVSLCSQVKQAVLAALDCGYRHIDCAAAYSNEQEVGEALAVRLGPGKVRNSELSWN